MLNLACTHKRSNIPENVITATMADFQWQEGMNAGCHLNPLKSMAYSAPWLRIYAKAMQTWKSTDLLHLTFSIDLDSRRCWKGVCMLNDM
jgi:hypothetical protein